MRFNHSFRSILVFYILCASCSEFGLDIHKVDDNFYVILGDGGNSGVLIADTAVLVVDTKMKQGAERMRQWVEKKADGRKVYIVNTHIHKDHTSGNHLYTNPTIIAGDYGEQFWNAVNAREDMPTIWLADVMELRFGDEEIVIENIGQAHTFDDVVVFFKKHQTLFAGDVVLNNYHPFLDEQAGSNVDGYIHAHTRLLERYPDITVVPGHGKIGESQLIYDFRQYMIDMSEAASNPDEEEAMQEKYLHYISLPISKAGFEQTLKYIRKSETLRE